MQSIARLGFIIALALAGTHATAKPLTLKNPLHTVKSCQSLEAQKTERCQRTEDYCARKTGDPACMRYHSLKQKYPFEQKPVTPINDEQPNQTENSDTNSSIFQ